MRANGVRFAYLQVGEDDGPLALCLHGFPDHAHTYRHLLPRLAAAGFRAVAPWMRGYAPTDVPADGDYDLDTLAADANGLHEALGGDERAVLVGHDWGASTAYRAAWHEPGRWARVVTLAVPPEAAVRPGAGGFRQIGRSWYILAFQSRRLRRRLVDRGDLTLIDRLWERWSPGYEREPPDRAPLEATLRSAGTLEAATGYYRALGAAVLRGDYPRPEVLPPRPTLYLHGRDDGCLGATVALGARDVLTAPSAMELVPGAGHFLHLERPDAVGSRIVAFVADGE